MLVASMFEIILILLFLLLLFTPAYALYNTKVMYFPVGNSLFCFPEGPYIKYFAIYLDFPLNNHVAKTNKRLLYSTHRQLRNGIPVGIHLNLIRGTPPRINQSQCLFCWVKV